MKRLRVAVPSLAAGDVVPADGGQQYGWCWTFLLHGQGAADPLAAPESGR